jgi:hypothetical protein
MKSIRRFSYLIYYLKESDFKQLIYFIKYARKVTGSSRLKIIVDSLKCVFIYNISLKDYFCFRFFELDHVERIKWAGTGYMYEYQLKMNPKEARDLLEDKIRFLNHFQPFINRAHNSLVTLRSNLKIAEEMLENSSGRLVLKGSHGQVGAEVEVIKCIDFTAPVLIEYMKKMKYDLAEEYVIQHPSLMELSASGLNTVRVFTQLQDGIVHFLGARLRVSVNSPVDNMAAGNLAAPVDIETGIVTGPGVFSDITKEDKAVHPLTGVAIKGFVVPHWNKVAELARNAALHTPENRSVGWDIAITGTGPELIEGNHNWCKILWQLPVKQGLKSELDKYL